MEVGEEGVYVYCYTVAASAFRWAVMFDMLLEWLTFIICGGQSYWKYGVHEPQLMKGKLNRSQNLNANSSSISPQVQVCYFTTRLNWFTKRKEGLKEIDGYLIFNVQSVGWEREYYHWEK